MKHLNLRLLFSVFVLLPALFTASASEKGYYCYSPEDVAAIRKSAGSKWGGKILERIIIGIDERRSHDLAVPTVEGGHIHHYFCDKDGQRLTFDWDKPHAHLCSACKTVYTGVDRYDWAWIYMVHRKNYEYLHACAFAYMATGKAKYAEYIRDMLLDYASKYPAYKEHNAARQLTDQHSGKAFAQSLDEATWITYVAPAYTVVKNTLKPDEVRRIEDGLLRPCAVLLLHRPAGANWQMWHNSGLAALGVALEDDSIIDKVLNDPERGYHALMKKHLNPDGWINEASPNYHYFHLQALIRTADVLRCRGVNLYDDDMRRMFSAPVKGVYPDLSFPAHSDGWYGASIVSELPIHELAYARMHDGVVKQVLEHAYAQVERTACEALLTCEDIVQARGPMLQPSWCYPESGFLCLRSGSITSVLKFGGQGIGHGHPDKLSITVHDGKKELVSDFGTCAYGLKLYLDWYRNSLPHNMVTVDYKNQHAKALGRLVSFEATPDGGTAEAECTDAYTGVDMRRSLALHGNTLYDTFECTSDSAHVYEYVLLFNERPQFEAGQGEAVVLGESKVHAHINNVKKYAGIGKELAIDTKSARISLTFDNPDGAELLAGEAPGIPALKLAEDGTGARTCYPVIVRWRGQKDMKVTAKWTISSNNGK